jgi:gas vesicle protein
MLIGGHKLSDDKGENKMENLSQEHENMGMNTLRFLAGVLVGCVAGASVVLLVAPQSGKKTRALIQEKGIELRVQATEAVEDVVAQARAKAHQITTDVHEKAEELQHRGQEMFDKQKERVSTLVG